MQYNLIPFERSPIYPIEPILNGFQFATFLFDARIAAEIGNDFIHLIFNLKDLLSGQKAISDAKDFNRD